MVLNIDIKAIENFAETLFINSSGFNQKENKKKNLYEIALEVREKLRKVMHPVVSIKQISESCLKEDGFYIEDKIFKCNKLIELNKIMVRGVYAFVLTIGEINTEYESITRKYFADSWGTSFTEAAMEYIKNELVNLYLSTKEDQIKQCSKSSNLFVRGPLSPGFYGMDISGLVDLLQLVDAEMIGVKLTSGGMMSPVKSCAGFYLVLRDSKWTNGYDCASCSKNLKGCHFCKGYKQDES